MTIKEAEIKARVQAVKENYERLSKREDWATMPKTQKNALMEIECGMSRPTLTLILRDLGIEL